MEGVPGETLLRSLLSRTVDDFSGYDGVRVPSCRQMWRLRFSLRSCLMIQPSGVLLFTGITWEMKQRKNPTFSFLKHQNRNEQSSRSPTAAVLQVFGRVWFHHLVLIVASSKSCQDPPPPFLCSGGKKQPSQVGPGGPREDKP